MFLSKGHRKGPTEVIDPTQGPRSFIIKVLDDATYRRNTLFLHPNTTSEEPSVSCNSYPALEETNRDHDPILCQSKPVLIPKMPDDSGLVKAYASPKAKVIATPFAKEKTAVCQRY